MRKVHVEQLKQHVEGILDAAASVPEDFASRREIGRRNAHGDNVIGHDVAVETAVTEYLASSPLSARLFSEEAGAVALDGDAAEYLVVLDPLDGSTNYKLCKGLQPYGVLAAIVRNRKDATFGDVVAAGAQVTMNDSRDRESRTRRWIYDGVTTTDSHGETTDLRALWELNGSTPVMLNLYKQEYYDAFRPIPGKLFPRNTGSAIGNLAHVLGGAAALTGDYYLKGEEAAAVYGLVTGAHGTVSDLQGRSIVATLFDPEHAYQVFAGNPEAVTYASRIMIGEA
jgi:fructose-1,6-bisphosphatase/inositol monophosphatase family enzyme